MIAPLRSGGPVIPRRWLLAGRSGPRAARAAALTALAVGAALVALAAALTSSGCTVGPRYKTPAVAVPGAFGELPAAGRAPLSVPSPEEEDLSRWWLRFHDAELQRLIERALASNLDLQAAASRIRQAREEEVMAGSALLPSLGSSATAIRLHANSNPLAGLSGGGGSGSGGGNSATSGSGGSSSAGGSGPSSLALTLYSLGFDASWELDVFGGTRRAVEAARASAEAAAWQLRDTEVSLTAEVANDYIQLRATQARARIVQQAIRSEASLLNLVQARERTGFVTELDVDQQQAQLAATRAELPPLQSQERALMHALAVLLAQQPQALVRELSAAAPVPAIPATLPVGLPSDLLRRRPDVREAERRLAAATAQEGVAVADLYPKFDLLGLGALAGSTPGSLIESRSLSELGLGFISWPIFQGGRREASVGAAEEERTQAYLAYRKAVLAALQDAEDALARYAAEQRRLVAVRQSQAAAAASLAVAEAQYRAGLVTFINVLQASAADLSARDQVEQGLQALAQDLVSLYKALGGGWALGARQR